jgi:hypothetical protein
MRRNQTGQGAHKLASVGVGEAQLPAPIAVRATFRAAAGTVRARIAGWGRDHAAGASGAPAGGGTRRSL